MRKRIAILGSTGSIGTQTLQCLRFFEDLYEVVALTCHSSKKIFEEQKREWKPKYTIFTGEMTDPQSALTELVQRDDVDCIVNAISGVAGVEPTIAALRAGKMVFLANKESLVMRGVELIQLAKEHGAQIVPLDSEAAGLWQLLRCSHQHEEKSVVPQLCPEKMMQLESVTITASGGPFFGFSLEQLSAVELEQVLSHPTWRMGKKITVDSATLVNKAFELIECARLFGLSEEKIKVLVDRKSYVHAGVAYTDGRRQWVVYPPDMRTPIADALLFMAGGVSVEQYAPQLPRIVEDLGDKKFETLDESVFPAVSVARRLLAQGDEVCAQFCLQNEIAVDAFINKKILFPSLL